MLTAQWHDCYVGLEGDECRAGPSHLLGNTCGLKRSYLGGKLSVQSLLRKQPLRESREGSQFAVAGTT